MVWTHALTTKYSNAKLSISDTKIPNFAMSILASGIRNYNCDKNKGQIGGTKRH